MAQVVPKDRGSYHLRLPGIMLCCFVPCHGILGSNKSQRDNASGKEEL